MHALFEVVRIEVEIAAEILDDLVGLLLLLGALDLAKERLLDAARLEIVEEKDAAREGGDAGEEKEKELLVNFSHGVDPSVGRANHP
jgi:hypothetical protein